MGFKNAEDEVRHLRKRVRILSRQLGDLKSELKVDVKALRVSCLKEGYSTCEAQMMPEIERMQDTIASLEEELQELREERGQ